MSVLRRVWRALTVAVCTLIAASVLTATPAHALSIGFGLGPWKATTNLPAARSIDGAVYAQGYLFLVGGIDASGTATSTVYSAAANINGTVGAWRSTTPFPAPLRSTRPEYYNGYLYVVGGGDGGNYYSAVYYARVNADGTLGAWNTTTALPEPQVSHSTVAYNGYLYVIGGNPGPCISTVRYAAINANGTLGAWNTTSALPDARCGIVEAATVSNGYLYLVGGYNNFDLTSTVFYARLNGNGTLGTWQTNATTITSPREYHGVEAVNGSLYVIGGQTALFGDVTDRVERAKINPNGSVGTFGVVNNLPAPRGYLATEFARGYIFVIGGGTDISGGAPQPTVYSAREGLQIDLGLW